MLRREVGEEAVAMNRAMLSGGLIVPESNDFGPCFRRTTKMIRRFDVGFDFRSEEHTSELQSLMRISYAVFCLKKKKNDTTTDKTHIPVITQSIVLQHSRYKKTIIPNTIKQIL